MNYVSDFESLQTGDYVRWNPQLADRWPELGDNNKWWSEPFDCVFVVSYLVKHGEEWERGCELSCVRDCGCHEVTIFSAEEYEEWGKDLGEPVLVWSGFHELSEFLLEPPEPVYDFEFDVLEIATKVERGELPKKRRL